VVLVLGNFMNRAYGFNGQAQGYITESLTRLADTKSTVKVKGRSSYNLLHHLIQVSDLPKINQEFPVDKPAPAVPGES